MNNKRFAPPAVGGTSLLVSLAVLLLTVLALLTLSHVRTERNLAEESAKNVEEYYVADMEAEKILALLRNGVETDGVTLENGVYAYSCPVSAEQSLFVEVAADSWEILRWETAASQPETE